MDSLAAPDRLIRITVPLGFSQASNAITSQPLPCPKGDEPVWTRFAMRVAGDYLAALKPLAEQLPEPLGYVELLRIDPVTQEFEGQTVDVNSGQVVYQAKGGRDGLQGYEEKLASIASQFRRIRIAAPFSDRVAGSVIINPPVPPGPTGQDLHMTRFVIQSLSDYNGGKAEAAMEAQVSK